MLAFCCKKPILYKNTKCFLFTIFVMFDIIKSDMGEIMEKNNKFYITTPIYYLSGTPHLGTCSTTVYADALARYNRIKGKEVFFLTGSDEHGQKVADKAEKQGLTPKEFWHNYLPSD